ncbi:hypothetical protein ABBQ38_002913 [Trebouxia sp. C0009 RCD-2024]
MTESMWLYSTGGIAVTCVAEHGWHLTGLFWARLIRESLDYLIVLFPCMTVLTELMCLLMITCCATQLCAQVATCDYSYYGYHTSPGTLLLQLTILAFVLEAWDAAQ